MKILFYRYGSICEPDILECLQQSGHEVTSIDEEIYDKNVSFARSVELVRTELDRKPCDCVFTVNFFPAISDLCNIYHIRYICWIVDAPVLELFSKSITNPWNRVFLFDRAQYEDIHPLNPNCVFHYPLAVNTKGKQQAVSQALSSGCLSNESTDGYSFDVSFVGSLYTEKCPMDKLTNPPEYLKGYLEGIIESQLKVYGYYFADELLTKDVIDDFKASMPDYYHYELDNFLTDIIIIGQYYLGNKITAIERVRLMEAVSQKHRTDIYTRSDLSGLPKIHGRGTCKTLTEMPMIFNRSKINLNPTSKAIRTGIPLRAFDIMACGGFMLSNYQSELCELFVPGEHFACYDSLEQVPDITAYYLEHDKEREEIAHNAYLKVKDEYSYEIRLNKLLLTAFEN